jgi:hypothetical protein
MNWNRDAILQKLQSDDRWIERALVAIYRFQTDSEKATETTRVHNDVGFNHADAPVMTSMAKQCIKRGFLTPKQIAWLRATTPSGRMRIGKYVGQLERIAKVNK